MNIKQVLRLINSLIPKSDELIVFASKPNFSDNSFAVYEAMRRDNRFADYRLVWVTDGDEKKEGIVSYSKKSLKGLYCFFRAKYVFTTHGLYVGANVEQQVNVGLWHGMPLKRIKNYYNDASKQLDSRCDYSYILATSELYRSIMAKCFNISESKVLVCGLPRNDKLFHPDDSILRLGIPNTDRVILWLPTFHNPKRVLEDHQVKNEGDYYDIGIPFWTADTIKELDAYLDSLKLKIVVKIHILQNFDKKILPDLNNVIFVTAKDCSEKQIDLYRLLACSDALITDYSSVYIDYLAIDRPMAFTLSDIEKYEKDRGFVFSNPLDVMPGLKVYKKEDLFSFLDLVATHRDEYKEEREKARQILNIFTDDNNTERLIDIIFG